MTILVKTELETEIETEDASRNIERQIGNTPLLSFRRVTKDLPANVRVLAKAEWQNPGGSVKDRAAYGIISCAEADGQLRPGKTILDSTSGNTGIAYAMIGAALGYRVRLYLPENASPERIAILRAHGAELLLTDPLEGSDGALLAVRDLLAREPGRWFYADQYNNPANVNAHYETTGVEIWQQTGGAVTHLVAGLGTSGTFTGTGLRLRDYNPDVQLVSVQPESPFHGLEGLKHMDTAIRPGLYDPALADRPLRVSTEAAHDLARRLAREEGWLVGISAAAALVAAREIALEQADLGQPAVIVTILPDSAHKYLSESFWQL